MADQIEINTMDPEDWTAVSHIYRQGIETGMATFEKEVPSWEKWDADHIRQCRLVAKSNDRILGWACLSPVSSRCVYGGVGEVSVYVAAESRGKGIGEKLLKRLIVDSESAGYWTLQSGIFPENQGSLELHKKAGFRVIGHKERIGQLDGVWKDNILMERRSKKTGL